MITIICAGSRGDFQPYVALAQSLKKLNKEVCIVGFKEFKEFVEHYGILFKSIDADYESLGVDPKMLKEAGSSDNPLKMLLTFNKMKKYGAQIADQTYKALEDSDLIVYHPGCTLGHFVAKEMGIPSVLASPFPMHQTSLYLSVITYGKSRPTKFNKYISYKMLQSMLWLASSDSVKAYWKNTFGRLPKNFSKPYEQISNEHPAIISCSNYVFPRPADWDVNIHQHGYWFVDEQATFQPSKELTDFLQSGDKPIYIGFGSVFNVDEKNSLVKIIVASLKHCHKRAIICGMGKIDNLPSNVISVDNIPHSWLFEQVSLVCHHGGAGTTAAGFKAGIPSVIIPFSNDQFAWAHRAFDLGVGSKPIYRKNLTSQELTNAINFALQDSIVLNAKRLATEIATEHGAAHCAKVISELLE
ncbi:MAG: glycosyltransferase [Cellulosilyticaceae bacterium]